MKNQTDKKHPPPETTTFIKAPRCKICRSHVRAEIDSMMANAMPWSAIASFAAANGLSPLNKKTIWVHNTRHRRPSVLQAAADEKAAQETIKEARQLVDVNEFLDEIISRTFHAIKTGSLKPTITEGLKAAEIKEHIHAGSPYEEALRKFVNAVSTSAMDDDDQKTTSRTLQKNPS